MLIQADARRIPLVDGCVQCVVTSPPYWGLRDYGEPGQIGLERTPTEYVEQLVAAFREVWRVLTNDGVVWLNLGDTYAGDRGENLRAGGLEAGALTASRRRDNHPIPRSDVRVEGLKVKDLVGIPWRVALALQASGWYLRADVIWHKPNPMPESAKDRPTKAHEYVFLLAKSEAYFYDAEAIAEPSLSFGDTMRITGTRAAAMGRDASGNERPDKYNTVPVKATRNRRSVWTVAPRPYHGAHFATMPEDLVEPCILAGSRPGDRVFDPFIGSGTVGAVAERLGRRWVGLDLNRNYHALARERTAQRGLMFEGAPV